MELSSDIAQTVQDVVLHPNFASALTLLAASFVNELFAVLPYVVVLSGQLLFLKSSISTVLIIKILLFVAVPVSIGTTLGSFLTYSLAYFGGKPAINKFSKYLHFSWKNVEKMESRFGGTWYDEIIFLCFRSVPFLPSLPLNIMAGILRMRLAPYIVLTLGGTLIKVIIMFMLVTLGVIGMT